MQFVYFLDRFLIDPNLENMNEEEGAPLPRIIEYNSLVKSSLKGSLTA